MPLPAKVRLTLDWAVDVAFLPAFDSDSRACRQCKTACHTLRLAPLPTMRMQNAELHRIAKRCQRVCLPSRI